MKILHVTPAYYPAVIYGGPIWSIKGLAEATARLDHDVTIVTTNMNGDQILKIDVDKPNQINNTNVYYFNVNIKRLYYSYKMNKFLKENIHKYDIVHLHSVFLLPTTIASRLCRINGIPYIISPRGSLVPQLINKKGKYRKNLWIKIFERNNIKHACAIHVTSDKEIEGIEQCKLKVRKYIKIANGVNINNEINSAGNYSEDTFLFLGRITWKKGLEILIRALNLSPDIKLIIAGPDSEGYKKTLQKLAAHLNVSNQIQWIGSVDEVDKSKLFSSVNALVLPSYNENFGNVVLEALSHNCPVIVSKHVGASEIVKEYGGGIIIEPTIDQIRESMIRLSTNMKLRNDYAMQSMDIINNYFNWNTLAEQAVKYYRQEINVNRFRYLTSKS